MLKLNKNQSTLKFLLLSLLDEKVVASFWRARGRIKLIGIIVESKNKMKKKKKRSVDSFDGRKDNKLFLVPA